MTFLWGGLLVLLLIVPILIGIYAWSLRRRRPSAVRYSSLSLIREAMPGSARLRRHLPFAVFAGALAALVLGLGRPTVALSVPSNESTIVLAIDVSGSMCATDIAPTRLEAAEAAAIAFVESQGPGTRIGIVAFSGLAAVVQPPTNDHRLLREAIASLATGRRTAIGSGILSAIDAIAEIDPNVAPAVVPGRAGVEPVPVPDGAFAPAIIVLLTDGRSNAGPEPLDAAQQAIDRGLRVYTIGFGTADGGERSPYCGPRFIGREPRDLGFGGNFGVGPGSGFGSGGGGNFRRAIDEETLRDVAALTDAEYHLAEDADQLNRVFADLPTALIVRQEVVEVSVAFVGLGGLLAAAALLLGRTWRPLP
jgi:Ca-activated chloride channel family protein